MNMKMTTARRLSFVALAAAVLTASAASAQQQDQGGLAADAAKCRPKSEADCGITEGCVWIPGFKVPSGAQVPGYCRPAPRDFKARRGTQDRAPQ